MDRTLLETVHFLGLDMELAVVAVMAALQGLVGYVEHLRAGRQIPRRTGPEPTSAPSVVSVWPPENWRSSH